MQTENVGSERQGKPDSAATIHMTHTYMINNNNNSIQLMKEPNDHDNIYIFMMYANKYIN